MPDKIEFFETTVTEEVRQRGQKKLKIDTELNADFRNLLIHGDCLSACAYLKSENIKVDLVYIDPPFATGANWTKKIYLRNGGRNEIDRQNQEIGEEIMYGDIWQKEDYLNWLYERLLAVRYVMNSEATIYLHIDSTVGHYVKVIMDEIFGDWEFAEIVWVCGLLGSGDFYPKSHESIYCYRSDKAFFDSPQKLGLSPRITGALSKDENGWFYTRGRESSGGSTYLKTYVSKNPNHTKEEAIEEANRLRNHPVWSVWMGKDELGKVFNENGVGTYAFTEEENVGYSTQKPEELLQRIIKASSSKDLVVADFFSGSGVTVKVANDLGRKFIACDIGINAIQTTRDRLVKAKAEFDVLKINDGVRLFRNPAQTVAKLFSLLDGYKDRVDLGLGEFWDGGMINKRGTFTPVKFIGIDKKLTKELVDVIIEEVIGLEENNQEVIETDTGIEDKIPTVKIIYAYKQLDVNQDYVNKTIKQSKKTSIKAELVSLDELLSQKADVLYTLDNAVVEMKQEGKLWTVEIKKYFSSYLKNKIDDYNNKKVKPRQKTLGENGDNGNNDGNGNAIEEEKPNGKPKIQISETGLELIETVQFDTSLREDGVWISNLDLEDKAGVKKKIKAVYKLTIDKFKMKIRNISGDEIIIDSSEIKPGRL
ncbi:MAG: site-specific DNA-methyltransferase [Bacteroidota bacterium]